MSYENEPLSRQDVEPSYIEAQLPHDSRSPAEHKHASKLHTGLHRTKRLMQTAAVAGEASHFTNEIPRAAALGAVLAETHNPVLGGLALGGSTLLIEGAGALAAAGLLESNSTTKVIKWLNKRARKFVKEGSQVSPVTEVGVGILGGAPALLAWKNIAEPDRTIHQNRQHGLFTASWLAAISGVGGAAFGQSILEVYKEPEYMGAGALAVGGLALVITFSRSLLRKNKDDSSLPGRTDKPVNESAPNRPNESFKPRYDLDNNELEKLEKELAGDVISRTGQKTIHAVWINSQSPYSNLVRTYETREYFPEIPDLMEKHEDECKFLALVDTREGVEGLVHAFRISSKAFAKENNKELLPACTGIALIDDLIDSEQGLTREHFISHYQSLGADIDKCIGVETNFRVKKASKTGIVPVPVMGYITLFNYMNHLLQSGGNLAIFSHLNRVASISLKAAGVDYGPVAGMESLKTPTVGEKKFDERYFPVAIFSTNKNLSTFRKLSQYAPTELEL